LCLKRKEQKEERDMTEPKMITVRGDGVDIQLAAWGEKGKTVLCIHGITANCRCWDVLAQALSGDYRVLAMDLRGRGLSDKPETGYSIETHCNDIRALLKDLGVRKAVLMGHSLGAFISLVFAGTYPEMVDRLILVDGGGKLSKEEMNKVFAGIKPSLDRLGKVFPSFEAYLDMMKQAPFLKEWSEALERYYRYEIEEREGGGIRTRIRPEHIDEEAANLRKIDVAEFYARVSCPVLILRAPEGLLADDDILLPREVLGRMLREIPNAQSFEVEGTNHYTIIFQKNDARDEVLRNFLNN
jgi:pimeloyl-ACP methyl ester carboxylesterase